MEYFFIGVDVFFLVSSSEDESDSELEEVSFLCDVFFRIFFLGSFLCSDASVSEPDVLNISNSEVSKNPVFKPVSSPSHSVDDNDNIDDDADNARES